MQRRFVHNQEKEHSISLVEPLLTKLLVNRGVTTQEEADSFLTPSYDNHMHDPFLLNDMEKAVKRVYKAISNEEKIVIYADYDCDGIPGAVIIHDLFKNIGYKNFEVYIPDRHEEGYGLNEGALNRFIDNGVKLIVTVDLGIADHGHIAKAQDAGIDVIVTDHHIPHETLPIAYAIVNPKVGDSYPEKMLCGAGVVFKFVQAFLERYRTEFGVSIGWEKWLLDMAGLATLSDMVPLSGENRSIAYFGMKVMRQTRRPGLSALFRMLRMSKEYLSEDDLTFMITPRLNAASRMDSPMRAFELLSETDTSKAGSVAEYLGKINDERKRVVASIMKEAHSRLRERELSEVIVIGDPSWRIGVLGLVAGKIVEEYERTTFVWGREGSTGEIIKGSCRSKGDVNVVSLMEYTKENFLDYGGHELAGGFSLTSETVHFLEKQLLKGHTVLRTEESLREESIDAVLSLSDVSEKTYRSIERLAPFGLGNPKPLFLFQQVQISKIRMFGKTKEHVEITFSDGSVKITGVAFFSTPSSFSRIPTEGISVDVIAHIEKSFFLGRSSLRLRIIDII